MLRAREEGTALGLSREICGVWGYPGKSAGVWGYPGLSREIRGVWGYPGKSEGFGVILGFPGNLLGVILDLSGNLLGVIPGFPGNLLPGMAERMGKQKGEHRGTHCCGDLG